MDTSKLSKATEDQGKEIEVAIRTLESSGKKVKMMGVVRELPLCEEAVKHFAEHRSEYVWRADPIENVREDINGLYYAVWITDKFDYIPVIYMTKDVMNHILEIKK